MSNYGLSSRLVRWVNQAHGADEAKAKSRQVFRKGKTARDHKRGLIAKNQENKDLRVSWQQDGKASQENFPWHTCNGKRNRSEWTGPLAPASYEHGGMLREPGPSRVHIRKRTVPR